MYCTEEQAFWLFAQLMYGLNFRLMYDKQAISWPLQAVTGRYWPLLAVTGRYWPLLVCDWPLLVCDWSLLTVICTAV